MSYNISMNKQIMIIVTGLILVIGAGVAFLLNTSDGQDATKNNQQNSSDTTQATTESHTESESPNEHGHYVDYSSNIIASTSGTKLLFFHAPWCPQCRALEADINKQGAPNGVTIIKVDYDSNQDLRKKYGVTLQTTVVRVDDQGELVSKFVAYDDPSLASVVENLL